MCHVTCLPRLWETIASSHRYLSYRLRELCATGLSCCTELNWTKLSWAPPWRTILYKYLRLARCPSMFNRLHRPAHSFQECHCECHTNCSLWPPSYPLPYPALACLLPSFVSALPGHNVYYMYMYCIYTWAARRAPKVDINNKWESEGCLLDYRICSTFHRLISMDLDWIKCGSPS